MVNIKFVVPDNFNVKCSYFEVVGCKASAIITITLQSWVQNQNLKRLWSYFDVMHCGDIMVLAVDQKRLITIIIIMGGDTLATLMPDMYYGDTCASELGKMHTF